MCQKISPYIVLISETKGGYAGCSTGNTAQSIYRAENAIITFAAWMADRTPLCKWTTRHWRFFIDWVNMCARATHIWRDAGAHTHTHIFECLWISQHAHYCLLPGWCRHVPFHTRSQLFLIFSSISQRILVCGSVVAGEPFSNVNNRRGHNMRSSLINASNKVPQLRGRNSERLMCVIIL